MLLKKLVGRVLFTFDLNIFVIVVNAFRLDFIPREISSSVSQVNVLQHHFVFIALHLYQITGYNFSFQVIYLETNGLVLIVHLSQHHF